MRVFILFGLLFVFQSAIADVIDPIGDDPGNKSVSLEIKLLDQNVYETAWPTSVPQNVRFSFANSKQLFSIKSFTSENTPANLKGKPLTTFETHDGIYSVIYGSFRLVEGELEKGTKKLVICLKRIDVNDMLITRSDGTTYYAPGYFSVSTDGGLIPLIASRVATRQGIFVPVGLKYQIVVRAKTEDDEDSYTKTLDFTNIECK